MLWMDGPPSSKRLLRHVYRDDTGNLTLDEIVSRDRGGRFQVHCLTYAAVPESGALWVRIDFRRTASAQENWVLVAAPFEIDELEVFRTVSGQLMSVQRSGRAVPAADRSLRTGWPAVSVTVEKTEPTRVYVRLVGSSAPEVSLKVLPLEALEDRDRRDLIIISAFFGFMAAMFAVNVVLYFRGRHLQSVYYCLYLILVTAHVIVYDGPLYQLSPVPVFGTVADGLAQATGILAGLVLMLCGRALLHLSRLMPRTDRVILATGVLTTVALVAEIAGLLPYAQVSSVCLGLMSLPMMVSAMVLAVRGSRSAVYFSMSYVAIIAAFAVETLAYFHHLPADAEPWRTTLTENWAFHIGICLETILIAFALSYFIRDMEGEVATVSRELEMTAKKAGVRVRIESANSNANPDTSSDEAFFEKALAVVHENLANENFGLDRLATALGVSPRTLRRRIDSATGLTPVEFLRQERLERGRRHLEAGTFNTIAEVARAVGIPNANYFSRAFREKFGVTPRSLLRKKD